MTTVNYNNFSELNMDPTKSYTFVAIVDGSRTNPNGDPSLANRPRTISSKGGREYGVLTNTSFKRKIRDVLEIMQAREGDPNDQNNLLMGSYKSQEGNIDGITEVEKVLAKFIDARLFGAVLTNPKPKNEKKKRAKKAATDEIETEEAAKEDESSDFTPLLGPVQFEDGITAHPVNIYDVTITRKQPIKEDGTGKMGGHYEMAYGCFKIVGNYNPYHGNLRHVSAEDLKLMVKAMLLSYGMTNSATRQMCVREVIVMEQKEYFNNPYSAETVTVTPTSEEVFGFDDLEVAVSPTLPVGVANMYRFNVESLYA